MIRTRVGYCGGSTDSPTYHSLGDHSETIELDYDPGIVTYEDLLADFLAWHETGLRSMSVQYRSAVFCRSDDEVAAAERALASPRSVFGAAATSIERLKRFWPAEDYHQKYTLRGHRDIAAQLRARFTDESAFRDSTSAARLNGWLDGWGNAAQIECELSLTGLSTRAQDEVRGVAGRRERVPRSIR